MYNYDSNEHKVCPGGSTKRKDTDLCECFDQSFYQWIKKKKPTQQNKDFIGDTSHVMISL